MKDTKPLTREALYAEVWSTPISHLAKQYGLSDRGLGKLCERHDIPVPPRGWWAKKAAGHRVQKAPLPALASGQPVKIIIEGQAKSDVAKVPVEPAQVPPEIAFERNSVNAVVVDENVRLSHPLVRDAASELRSRRADREGIIHTPPGCLDVRVSKESVRRALCILQALIRALESRGYSVAVKDGKTFTTVLGEPYRIFLKERLRQTVRDLTPEEHKRRREGIEVKPYELVPSGECALHVGDSYSSRVVSDRKRSRLEGLLNLFIEKLVAQAYADKAARATREEEERRRGEAEKRAREVERQTRIEEARRDHFDGLVQHWKRNEERRAFLARLRSSVGKVEPDSELGQWFDWAERFIEVTDVLRRFRDFDEVLTLYYSGYSSDIARIRREGFTNPEPASDRSDRRLVGITLREGKAERGWYSESLEIQLPLRAVISFEVTEPGYVPRAFQVPATLLNSVLGLAGSSATQSGGLESEEEEDEDL